MYPAGGPIAWFGRWKTVVVQRFRPYKWKAKMSAWLVDVPRQLYLPICRQLVLPIDLLLLAALLGRAGGTSPCCPGLPCGCP